MNDKQAELERQVACLTIEVRRLRQIIMGGLGVFGILLAVIILTPGPVSIVLVVGAMLVGVIYVGATLATALSRRAQRKRGHHII